MSSRARALLAVVGLLAIFVIMTTVAIIVAFMILRDLAAVSGFLTAIYIGGS